MTRRESIKMISAFSLAAFFPVRTLSQIVDNSCDVCLKAWKGLSRFTKTRYQFRYIEPTANLPKVFIYGDSISIGYTEYVRAALEGKANVFRLHKNGQSSHNFIPNMETIRKTMFQPFLKGGWDFEWDLIHFNVGLHDLKYIAGKKLDKKKGTLVSSLEVYEENLVKMIHYLKKTYPKAKLVFATTTPVPEGESGRFEGDAVKYNAVALKVLKSYPEIIINDLYTVSVPIWKSHGRGYGDVHYTDEGSRLQGIEVAKIIGDAIGVTPNECPSTKTITAQFKAYESKIKK